MKQSQNNKKWSQPHGGWTCAALGGAALVLALNISCSRDSSQNIGSVTTHNLELDRDKDGRSDVRVESHRRGGKDIYVSFKRRSAGGNWSESRSYSVPGKLSVVETDKDDDRFFETLMLLDPSHKVLEVFLRSKDGSVVVATPELKAAYQEQFDAGEDFWRKSPDPAEILGVESIHGVESRIRQTQQRIDAAEKVIEQRQQLPSAKQTEPASDRKENQ